MLRNLGENAQACAVKKMWMRQAVAATAAVSMALSGMTIADAKNVNPFVDVPKTNGFYDYVHELANEGIIGGYDNGMYFKPNNSLKRGQMAKMFVSVIEAHDVKPFQRENKLFTDTKGTSYEGFASKAYRYDIVDGYGTNFKPNDNATRGQIAKLIVETFGFEKKGTVNPYKDTLNTAHADYVQILFEQGITNSPGSFHPNEVITRGQFAKMLAIALEKWEEAKVSTVQVPANEGEKELGEETVIEEVPEQQASATVSVRAENGRLNSMLSLAPKHTQTMSQNELDAIQNIRLYGDTAHFPSLPIGKYEVRVTALNGSYLGEVVQGATFEVKQGVENAHEVVVNTSGDKVETPTSPTTPTEEANVDKQEVVNVVPTNPSKPSTNGDVIANGMVTLKWRITDENGEGLRGMSVKVTPSHYDGIDVLDIVHLNSIGTDENGEFEVTVPNDRSYTIGFDKTADFTQYGGQESQIRGNGSKRYVGINGVESVFVSKEELQSETDGVYEGALPLQYIKDVGLITNLEEFREEFLRLLNEERQSLGLGTVEYNAVLNEVAEERAQYVVDNVHFSHYVVPNSPSHELDSTAHAHRLLYDRGYDYDSEIHNIMENLASTHLQAVAEDVFVSWKTSAGHYRAFLVEDFKYIGLNFVPSYDDGYIVMYIGSSTNF